MIDFKALELEMVNALIAMAEINGADCGDSYKQNELEQVKKMMDWLILRDYRGFTVDHRTITYEGKDWSVLQFVRIGETEESDPSVGKEEM